MSMNKVDDEIVYASDNNTELEVDEKRKNDDNENNEEETFSYTFKLESVAHFSENIEGMSMYFSHVDNSGAYFTYKPTEKPKEWNDGYWYVPFNVMEQGYYNVNLLKHNDELKAIYIADEVNGGYDYMQLKPSSDTESSYAFQ